MDLGDKPSSFVGSRNWIGAIELNYVLDTHMGVSGGPRLSDQKGGADQIASLQIRWAPNMTDTPLTLTVVCVLGAIR